MTDAELDALLANAKPGAWEESCYWAAYEDKGHNELPDDVFYHLSGGVLLFGDYREYPTELEAMDALRAAVAKYKEQRQ